MDHERDLIVIGGGSGGIAAARRAASHGARVALVEQSRLGGTCVMRGCVPKKLLMYASQFGDTANLAEAYGWQFGQGRFDMNAWQDAKSSELNRLESIYRAMLDDAKVETISGRAVVEAPGRVRVGNVSLEAKRVLLAVGGRPATILIPGLDLAMTSDDILELRSVPLRLAVVGAGYIGMEFASMFARLGSEVSVFFRGSQPLRGFDDELRQRLGDSLMQAGVRLRSSILPRRISRSGDCFEIHCLNDSVERFDAVLNATGRVPNTSNLGLEKLGVEMNMVGAVCVDHYSETSVQGIYAVGDITNRANLTPVAIAEGRAFADTVFGGIDTPVQHDQIPSAVFTDPPIGTVGLTESQAARYGPVSVFMSQFRPMRTAFAKRDERTFMKLIVDASNDRVLGVHMIGPDAPEIVQALAVAIRAGATKRQFDQTIAIHPTTAEEFVLMREPVRRVEQTADQE